MRRGGTLVALALLLVPGVARAERRMISAETVAPPASPDEPAAERLAAVDPPPAPVDDTPREAMVATIAAISMRVPDGQGGVERWGEGVSLLLSYLERRGDFPTGFEGQASFLDGEGERLYTLGASIVGSGDLQRGLAPFLSTGLDLAASSVGGAPRVAIGVHGDLGIHGFVGRNLYLRASAGWLGAGDGGIRVQLGVGWMFNGH